MDKRSLNLLEMAYQAEINGAVNGGIGLIQSKSKLARKLVEDGYLQDAITIIKGAFPVTVEGYCLTHLGRMTYCATC